MTAPVTYIILKRRLEPPRSRSRHRVKFHRSSGYDFRPWPPPKGTPHRTPVVDKDGNATVEEVGTLDLWVWPSPEEVAEAKEYGERKNLTPETIDAIIDAFCCKTNDKTRVDKQSPDWFGYAAMPAIGLDPTDRGDKNRMETYLRLLVESDDLKEVAEQGPSRHLRRFFRLSKKTEARLVASEK